MPKSTENDALINVSIEEQTATLTISNPKKRNAFTQRMCMQLRQIASRLEPDPDVRIVVLRGAQGDFSAGAAIDDLSSILFDTSEGEDPVDHFSAADQALSQLSKPTVAVVEGVCMGGGWQMASACDFILASSTARVAITPAKIGILYPRRGVERLIRMVGPSRAKYVLMSAKTFSAQQAQEVGLLTEVIAADGFETNVQDFISDLLRRSRFSQEKLKEFIDLFSLDPATADYAWDRSWEEMLKGPDMHIGIEAFRAQISPQFRWAPLR